MIFTMELNDWFTDPDLGPSDRGWPVFQEWFDSELADIAWDLVDGPLSSAPPPERRER